MRTPSPLIPAVLPFHRGTRAAPPIPAAVSSEEQDLRLEVARLKGQVEVLEHRIAALDAADEHRRAELESARAEAADARAELKESRARVDEWRRQLADARERLVEAERQRVQAESERAAVIAALGRRARKQLADAPDSASSPA